MIYSALKHVNYWKMNRNLPPMVNTCSLYYLWLTQNISQHTASFCSICLFASWKWQPHLIQLHTLPASCVLHAAPSPLHPGQLIYYANKCRRFILFNIFVLFHFLLVLPASCGPQTHHPVQLNEMQTNQSLYGSPISVFIQLITLIMAYA